MKPWLVSSVILSCVVAPSTFAWNDCEHTAERSVQADLAGIERVEITAKAGDLRIRPQTGDQLIAEGDACASESRLLNEIQLRQERSGNTLRLITDMPETKGWSSQARMDLEVRLPAGMEVELQDGSGDIDISGVTLVRVHDGSGDMTLNETRGDLKVKDGSGDVRISDHQGNVGVEDGSGDVRITSLIGNVRIGNDGSGDLSMRDIEGSVDVARDGSGDIFAKQVSGDFVVARAGSGDVIYRDIGGRVDVPADD